jgi:hypothetical protein
MVLSKTLFNLKIPDRFVLCTSSLFRSYHFVCTQRDFSTSQFCMDQLNAEDMSSCDAAL